MSPAWTREIIRTEPPCPHDRLRAELFSRPSNSIGLTSHGFQPATDGARRLRPWICLIVIPKERATFKTNPQQPLPALTCALEELPDLDQSWAWAHAQIVAEQRSTPDPSPRATLQQLSTTIRNARSRLLAPRRLDPNTAYYACLVPTYDVGRKAGLGRADQNRKMSRR